MTFKEFLADIGRDAHLALPHDWNALDEIQLAQRFLTLANRFFFQTSDQIGLTDFDGEEFQYFSEFHRFWETNHQRIINCRIDRGQARLAAEAFIDTLENHGHEIFELNHNLHGLTVQQLAQVRFFTASQDFRQPPENQFAIFLEQPEVFERQAVQEDPDAFLGSMGLNRLSQSDKRRDFAKNSARFLNELNIDAYGIADRYNNDAVAIRAAIMAIGNTGYGAKKTNMFIRDMFVWHVWPNLENIELIDVASDLNTMKVALRARILQTDIPLLSSFLDIFCHQYGYIDNMSARAWRVVWEEWVELDSETAPESPCMLDFFIYRLGREYCMPKAGRYECEGGHHFWRFGNRLVERRCPICDGQRPGVRRMARLTDYLLPCQVPPNELPRNDDGSLLMDADNLFHVLDGNCLFTPVCRPNTPEFRLTMPPKSISVKGQTGWTEAYSYQAQGGGGLSS